MPTPIKPDNLASLKRQNRTQGHTAATATAMRPPAHLTGAETVAFVEIVGSIPSGILALSDLFLIELTARLLAKSREPGELNAALAAQLRGALAAIGATPTDRARLAGLATPPQERDPLDEALGRTTERPKKS